MQEQDTITKYNEELKLDTNINELNLKEMAMRLPALKHKWVSRLINHKQRNNKLKQLLKQTKDKIIEELKNNSPVILTNPVLEAKADNTEACKKIQNEINEQYLIIDYLEKVETIFRGMSYDVSNLIKIIELETT